MYHLQNTAPGYGDYKVRENKSEGTTKFKDYEFLLQFSICKTNPLENEDYIAVENLSVKITKAKML